MENLRFKKIEKLTSVLYFFYIFEIIFVESMLINSLILSLTGLCALTYLLFAFKQKSKLDISAALVYLLNLSIMTIILY